MDKDKDKAPACDRCKEKKIKCDRGLPQCQNCLRTNLPCESLSQKKRTNPTKQLVSDFEKIAARLDELDRTVLRSANAIEQLVANQSVSPSSDAQRAPGSVNTNGIEEEEELPPDLPYFSINQNGHEMYHGPTSLLALLNGARNQWLSSLEKDSAHASSQSETLKRSRDSSLDEDFPFSVQQKFDALFERITINDMLDLSNDGSPMVLPPRNLLDALSGPFFEHVNPIMPSFGKDSFMEAVKRIYASPHTPIDVPWALMFNNVILATLPIHSGSAAEGDRSRTKLAADLARPFIMNARCCLGRLDMLLSPRFESVEALLSFSIITSKNLQIRNGAFYLNQACTLAKTIGLHQQSHSMNEITASKREEREKTFWALFIMDKLMSTLLGTPCSLPSHDINVPIPTLRLEHPLYGHFVARIQMARIQEKIYSSLYSTQAREKSRVERMSTIAQLREDLPRWHTENLQTLPQHMSGTWAGKAFINVELMHSYYTAKILVLRRCSDPGSKAKCLEAARTSIRFMQQSRKAKLSVGGFMVLRRPFQFYPFVSFLELFSNFASYPQPTAPLSDLELLRSAVEMLREITSLEFPTTYVGKIFDVASTCADIATSLVESVEGRRNARSKPSPVEQTAQPIHPNPFLNRPHQMASVITPGLSTSSFSSPGVSADLPVHPIMPPYGNRLGLPSMQTPPQPNPLGQYLVQSNGSSPATFMPNQPSHSLAPNPSSLSSSLSPALHQQERGNSTSNGHPLANLDFPSFGSFGDGMMDSDNANFGPFDFDMDGLWGDPQLLEEMARDTNLAAMADGSV